MTVPHSPITPGWDAECHGSAYILPASAQRASATGPMPAQIPNRRSRVLKYRLCIASRVSGQDAKSSAPMRL
ncbi:hypothetical protein Plhal304r1_c040g0118381 [Plasmopara halstedii]